MDCISWSKITLFWVLFQYFSPEAGIQYFGAISMDWFSLVEIVWTKKELNLTYKSEITNALKNIFYFIEKQIFSRFSWKTALTIIRVILNLAQSGWDQNRTQEILCSIPTRCNSLFYPM